MSGSTAIGMVSKSLRNLLIGEMSFKSDISVTILSPNETGGVPRINLFLYKIKENSALKNLDWQVKHGEPDRIVAPHLSLNLFYLMTSYAANDDQTGNSTAQEILGDAMRALHENAIIPQKYLVDGVDGLKGSREQIKVVMNTLDIEELSKVWGTFSQPFRLSVLYEVSVVQLDMLPKNERGIEPRVKKIGKPSINAPYIPPVIESIEPARGPVSTAITFYGTNLVGWKAYVTVMGRKIVDGTNLNEDFFQITIPADLPPGFHEIRVDISHLFRRTFNFEVTK